MSSATGARIQHVSVPRPPGSDVVTRAFYGDLIGLEEIVPPRSLAALDLIWYKLGDSELHLFAEEPSGQDPSGRHFCLAVDDVETLRERLEGAGVTVVGTIPIPGRPRYFVRDPHGNLVEICTIEADYRDLERGD
jgi:catechol 2,3-dioxygenase-like lactoylglutathione lyase family enzyme